MLNNQFSQHAETQISTNTDVLPHLAVLILAAGLSRRLGQPKQLLLKNGKPLVRHVAELAISLNPQCVMVVANHTVEISSLLEDLPIQLVLNPQADTGMASSLQTGALCLNNHHGQVLIVGIDQPLLDAAYLQRMVQQNIQYPDMNIVSQYSDTIGIPAIVQPELLQQSESLAGDSGLKKLLMQQPDKIIKMPAPQLAFDIDTPEALQHTRQNGWID